MSLDIRQIADMDRRSVLHPFTQLKDFATGKTGDPTIVTGGKGIRIENAKGNQLIDAFAGLYCVNIGYGRDEVAEAISRQAYRLAYYHSYAAHTTEELARLSLSAAAGDTVAKMMTFSVPPGYRRTAEVRRPKLDRFIPIIEG